MYRCTQTTRGGTRPQRRKQQHSQINRSAYMFTARPICSFSPLLSVDAHCYFRSARRPIVGWLSAAAVLSSPLSLYRLPTTACGSACRRRPSSAPQLVAAPASSRPQFHLVSPCGIQGTPILSFSPCLMPVASPKSKGSSDALISLY